MRTLLLALLPFICFCSGYLGICYFMQPAYHAVPELIGCSLHDALAELSSLRFTGSLVDQREDADLPPATVIDQMPRGGTQLAPHHTVGLIITKAPEQLHAPRLIGQRYTPEEQLPGIRIKGHPLPLPLPRNTCYAHYPPPGAVVPHGILDLYYASGEEPARIMPSLVGLSLQHALSLLATHHIPSRTFHTREVPPEHSCISCKVAAHKPSEGAVIRLTPPPLLQLLVTPEP